jgi:FKBP-type peptidyl-prolyl cis-trans isomerase FklB
VSSPCECHYQGTLIDGTKFDSSYDRGSPTTFAPNQVIKGWTEAMQLMVEGDKWEMYGVAFRRTIGRVFRPPIRARASRYIPSDLGYGDRGSPPKIGALLRWSLLLFSADVEMW